MRNVRDPHGDQPEAGFQRGWEPHDHFGTKPELVAFDLLCSALGHRYDTRLEVHISEHWLSALRKRTEEAGLIERNVSHVADPALFNRHALARRIEQGECDPRPRVTMQAAVTEKGNLSVRLEPFVDRETGEPDLLQRQDLQDPYSGWHGRPWQEVLFIREYNVFGSHHPSDGTGPFALSKGMMCVFTLRAFQYVVHLARRSFEIEFGNVLCLGDDDAPVPTLRIVPHAQVLDERRRDAEAVESLRRERRARERIEWSKTLGGPPHIILAAIEASMERGEPKKVALDLLRGYGISANYGSLDARLDELREVVGLLGTTQATVDADLLPPPAPKRSNARVHDPVLAAQDVAWPARSGSPDAIRFEERFSEINKHRIAKGWAPLRPIRAGYRTEMVLQKLAAQSGLEPPE